MTLRHPDVVEQALVQAARELEQTRLENAERRAEVVVGGLAVAAMVLLWAFPMSGSFDLAGALACAVGMLVARKARFDVGGGFTFPVQLLFIPLLFAVPPQLVPVTVVAVMAAARLPGVVAGTVPPTRLALELGNSWFAIGAAATLIAVGGPDAVREHPVLAVLVVAGQLVGDTAASALREALLGRLTLRELVREATWVSGVDAVLAAPPLFMILNGGSVAGSAAVLIPLVGLLGLFAHERAQRLDGLIELQNAYHGTAMMLGDVVEADHTYTGQHSRGVVQLALRVGRELGLDDDRMRNLEFAALLHDVGKVAIPKEIIDKPGRLDVLEWEIVKTHTVEGQRMLDKIGGIMGDVGRIVRSHHERWDGGGYPDGLAGEAIALEARIVTACDSFNAMTTDRPYRAAMPVADAVRELCAHAGRQFDPHVVEALVRIVAGEGRANPPSGAGAGALQAA